jgi:hypothetical protein
MSEHNRINYKNIVIGEPFKDIMIGDINYGIAL